MDRLNHLTNEERFIAAIINNYVIDPDKYGKVWDLFLELKELKVQIHNKYKQIKEALNG